MVTALFDGRCVICQTTRAIMNALDWFGRVEFLDLHDKVVVESRYPHMNHDAMMGEIHVITADGDVFAGFDATRRMLREVPLGAPLWGLLQLPGMSWLGPQIYKFIARNRYAINRLLGVELDKQDDCVDGVCKVPWAQDEQKNAG